jgi:ATP-binding cassette subfamily F protein 3
MSLVSLGGAGVDFGSARIFDGITFTVGAGDRWGIVGRNGTGKTTLFRLIAGDLEPTRGSVARLSGLRVTLLDQHREFREGTTIWAAAATPFAELMALEHSLAEQAEALAENASEQALARYDRDLERFGREGGYTFHARVDAVLQGLGFDPEAAKTAPVSRLSGGEQGRVALARQLVAPADLLLLDEPTNHLDLETTRWLEEYLRTLEATVVLISHDRAFLEAVVDHVLHFEGGTAAAYKGGYSSFVAQRAERRLTQERSYAQQQKKIAAEEEYIRRNIAGQNSRQAKGRRTRLARLPRLGPPAGEEGVMALRLEAAERGGDQVAVAEGVRLAIGERVLIDDFSARVERGDVIGFIGPNGAGKSTLLRALTGERSVEGGSLRVGESIGVAYYRQDLSQIPPDRVLFDLIHDLRPRWDRGQVQGHLGRFGFSGEEAQRRAGSLSGGERARVALALMMLSGPAEAGTRCANLLIFDEPTNHLDVESIEVLEEALEEFEGTVILVSHDRALLRALATRVWVLEGERITDFTGSFAEWEELSREREAAAAALAAEATARQREAARASARQRSKSEGAGQRERRAEQRAARRTLEEIEARVAELEAREGTLSGELEDPRLYETTEGSMRALELQAELEVVRRELEAALSKWEGVADLAG